MSHDWEGKRTARVNTIKVVALIGIIGCMAIAAAAQIALP